MRFNFSPLWDSCALQLITSISFNSVSKATKMKTHSENRQLFFYLCLRHTSYQEPVVWEVLVLREESVVWGGLGGPVVWEGPFVSVSSAGLEQPCLIVLRKSCFSPWDQSAHSSF